MNSIDFNTAKFLFPVDKRPVEIFGAIGKLFFYSGYAKVFFSKKVILRIIPGGMNLQP